MVPQAGGLLAADDDDGEQQRRHRTVHAILEGSGGGAQACRPTDVHRTRHGGSLPQVGTAAAEVVPAAYDLHGERNYLMEVLYIGVPKVECVGVCLGPVFLLASPLTAGIFSFPQQFLLDMSPLPDKTHATSWCRLQLEPIIRHKRLSTVKTRGCSHSRLTLGSRSFVEYFDTSH